MVSMDQKEKDQLLALKVMRLTHPTITGLTPLMSCDVNRDLMGDSYLVNHTAELSILPRNPLLTLSADLLTLPQNFGTIFLGERFIGYCNVHNHSDQNCTDVLIKVDLQTGSQKLSLSGGTDPPIASIPPNTSKDEVIKHEIKELGTHILVCSVSYLPQSGERMYFRKFFKFHVYKPLDVKTKFYNIKPNKIYLEAQLQNITLAPIFLERVTLDPNSNFSVEEIHLENQLSPFGPARLMNPQDTRQFLFCLKIDPTASESADWDAANVGKLDITWFVNGGEKGRLQTSQLSRNIPAREDLDVAVDLKNECDLFNCHVGLEYKLPIIITNNSDRGMELKLSLSNSETKNASFVWAGVSGHYLGVVDANTRKSTTLQFIPLVPGLIKLTGLRLIDVFLKRTYEFNDSFNFFVTS